MLRDFNLIGTTPRWSERDARYELGYLLEQVGDSKPIVGRTGIAGVIVAKTAYDPFTAVEKLREVLHERPYEFRYLLRVIPIEKIVHTNLEEIQRAASELHLKIEEKETFRITLEKRFTRLHTRDIVEAAAAQIKNKVSLHDPDKILLIEILSESTGLSVIKPDGILSVLKEKMI
jgi:tRNA acetyltransferase TAN1